MKSNRLVFFLFLAVITACETVVDIDIPIDPPSLVINSTLIDDEYIKVHISQSQHILDEERYKTVTGATVEIYENGDLLTTLPDSLEGHYISATHKPTRGNTYEVRVTKAGFETASARVLLPLDTVDIISIKMDTIQENSNGYIQDYLAFNVEIKDNKDYNNYYSISIYKRLFSYSYDFSVTPPLVIDSAYMFIKLPDLRSNDPSLEEHQSNGSSILFNDELFNGKTFQMEVLAYIWFDPYYEGDVTYFVSVKNTSESYYLYTLSTKLQTFAGENPFAQPVMVYSNIENGFGIFGAYNTAVVKIQ